MVRASVKALTRLTLAALVSCGAGELLAAPPSGVGQVRISDMPQASRLAVQPTAQSAIQPVANSEYSDCGYSGGCPTCGQNIHYTKDAMYLNGRNYCTHPHGKFYLRENPTLNWLFCERYCTYSPDHGWAVPAKHPVERTPVNYQSYWPERWYGAGNGNSRQPAQHYPVIYRPTDTTQLGFYYQHTPQFQPNPNMIPPAPCPSDYHIRECRECRCCPSNSGCYSGAWGGEEVMPYPVDAQPESEPPPSPESVRFQVKRVRVLPTSHRPTF